MKPMILYFRQLHAYAGFTLWMNLAGMVVISFFAGIGTFMLIPVLNMSGLTQVSTEIPVISDVTSALHEMDAAVGLAILLLAYAAVNVGQHLLQRFVSIQNVRLMNEFGREVRLETYGALLRANWQFFLSKRKADLLTALTSELARVIHGTYLLVQLLASLVFTLIQIGLSFWFSAEITGFVLLCGMVLAFFSQRYIKKAKTLGSRTSELAQSYMAEVSDQLNGMKEIKSNNLAGYRWNFYQKLTRDMVKEQMDYIRLKTGTDFFYKLASVIFIVAFIYVSAVFFKTRLDQLFIVVIIFARLWPTFTGLQSTLQQLASSVPAFQSVMRLQQECKEAEEELQHEEGKTLQLQNGIECKDVYFRYREGGETYALKHINLFIPSRGMTAIVGRSGAGKSTLIDLLMGLIQPEQGSVLVDGIPMNQVSMATLRNAISYVPQDPYLFTGTIRENLKLAKPDAAEEEMWRALEFASAASFVSKLPQGLETELGDRGVRLSGGERQRLVLARAILRKPSILILDEATSALDTENERNIQEALERLKGHLTIIVIAHRLSTIRHADQVIVLDEGQVVQRGGFQQLAEDSKGLFRRLLGNQLKASAQ